MDVLLKVAKLFLKAVLISITTSSTGRVHHSGPQWNECVLADLQNSGERPPRYVKDSHDTGGHHRMSVKSIQGRKKSCLLPIFGWQELEAKYSLVDFLDRLNQTFKVFVHEVTWFK